MISGPFEFVVISFEGDRFTCEILPQVRKLQEKGMIKLADLVFVSKDEYGEVSITEVTDLRGDDAQAYAYLTDHFVGVLSVEDVEQLSAGLPLKCSAAIVLFEHIWAASLKETIMRADGRLLSGGLVGSETVEKIRRELAETMLAAR